MNFQPILRALDRKVFDLIQPFKVTDDKFMPLAYRNTQGGRPLHDDWAFMKSTPRIETAYRVPLPFKQISGKSEKRWMLWDTSYPTSPGTPIEYRDYTTTMGAFSLAHALVDCAGPGWASFAVWLNGEWVPCFKQYHDVWFGKRLSYYSGGLKQDVTVSPPQTPEGRVTSDLMGWWEFPTASFVKES